MTFLELAVLCALGVLAVAPLMLWRRGQADQDVIELWSFVIPEERSLFLKVIEQFEKQNPGVKVKLVEPSTWRPDKLLVAMQAGSCGDVISVHWTKIPVFASKNTLLPLDELCKRDEYDLKGFFQDGLSAYIYNGQLCALPFRGSTMILCYNKDIFDKAGLPYPTDEWTWDDFLDAAKKLTVVDKRGRMTQVGCLPYDPSSWVWSAGGDFANDDLSEIYLTSPRTLEGLSFYEGLRNRWKVTVPSVGVTGGGPADMDVFEKGGVAMAVTGPWMLTRYIPIKSFRWDIALFPKGAAGRQTRYAGVGFAVWSGTNKRELAWKLTKFMCGKEAGKIFGQGFFDIPTRRSIAYEVFAKQEAPFDIDVLLKSLEPAYARVRVYPKDAKWDYMQEYFFQKEFEAVMVGEKTLEEGMQAAETQIREYLAILEAHVTWGHYVGMGGLVGVVVGVMIWRLKDRREGSRDY